MTTESLSAELQRALLHELLACWHHVNRRLFAGALTPPLLSWEDHATRLGQWRLRERRIALSLTLVRTQPWTAVLRVLEHEMAHQYVHEVLRVFDESAHGPAFQQVCALRSIDARAQGMPESGAGQGAEGEDRVLRRVRKLLALAESPHVHEAEAAAHAAQRLMLEHNLSAVAQGLEKAYEVAQLGSPVLRMSAFDKMLGGLLSAHYFVHVMIVPAYVVDEGRWGHALEATGAPENLAMAQYVYSFLHAAGTRAFAAELRAGRVQARQRTRFLAGFARGVGDKLRRAQELHAAEGLVWLGDQALRGFVQTRYPRLRSAQVRVRVDGAHEAGRGIGKQVVIAKPMASGAQTRGRLLGG